MNGWKRKQFCIILALFNLSCLHAQVFNEHIPMFGDRPFFNEEWVVQKKILRLRGTVSYKRDNHPIENSMQFYDYRFDRKGRLISCITTYQFLHRMDTLYSYYFYNDQGLLTKVVSSDAYGFYAMNYLYNSHKPIRQYHSREYISPTDTGLFVTDHIVWNDSIHHERLSPVLVKSIYFNQSGKPYREVLMHYDEKDRLVKSEGRQLIGGDQEISVYEYGENGRLKSIEETVISSGTHVTLKTFLYDSQNRIDKEIINKEGSLYTTRKLTYDANGLIELQLIRNSVSKVIEIIKYEYEFYE